MFIFTVHLTSTIAERLSCSGKSTATPNIPAVLFNFQLVWFQVIPVQILLEKGKQENVKLEANSHHVCLVREGGLHTSNLSDWI